MNTINNWYAYLSKQVQQAYYQATTSQAYRYYDRNIQQAYITPFYREHVENRLSPMWVHNAKISAYTLLAYFVGRRIYKRGVCFRRDEIIKNNSLGESRRMPN